VPASPGRGYPLQATQRAQFGRVVFLAGVWRARGHVFLARLGRSRRVSVGAPCNVFRRGAVAARRVPVTCLWRPVAGPLFARAMRRTGNVAASIRRRMARLALRAGLRVRRTLSPHSSGDRATASGAVCVGSNPTGGAFSNVASKARTSAHLADQHFPNQAASFTPHGCPGDYRRKPGRRGSSRSYSIPSVRLQRAACALTCGREIALVSVIEDAFAPASLRNAVARPKVSPTVRPAR
jgi:hypothetical protein